MGVLWQGDFHRGCRIDLVALLDPSSSTVLGGRDVTKRQKGLPKERGEQTSRLGQTCTRW